MKKVDVLLQRAHRLDGVLHPTVSFMSYENGAYKVQCGLWDGRKKNQEKVSIHATREEAMEAYNDFLKRYKEDKRAAPILIDLSDLQGGGDEIV